MKRNDVYKKLISRISRRNSLPLLRGMFVAPEPVGRVQKVVEVDYFNACCADEGLFLTAKECYYLGE